MPAWVGQLLLVWGSGAGCMACLLFAGVRLRTAQGTEPRGCAGAGKWKAVVTEIRRMHKSGRPTLVGTTSVERSEALAKLLDEDGALRHSYASLCHLYSLA